MRIKNPISSIRSFLAGRRMQEKAEDNHKKNNFVYYYYRRERNGEDQLIGTLTERRRNPERITHASIMNWAKQLAPEDVLNDRVYFVRWEIQSEPRRLRGQK